MQFTESPIGGAFVIDPTPHSDDRGRFMRAWCADEFASAGIDFTPVQANLGFSIQAGTTRGLHYQVAPDEEAKLVRCTRGVLFDVLVDLRPGSATFGRWFGTELTPENGRMLYVPAMCAHGCQSLVDQTEFHYMASAKFASASSKGLKFDDPVVAIQWPLAPTAVSPQDRGWPSLHNVEQRSP